MANKTFNTRVKNKRDTAANWEAVATTFQPLDGELIIVDTAAGKTRFKVGRYDTAKGRLLYYNEIPFTDEYLYNDLNESQGKIYDKLKGIDDKSIIEMTLESVFDNTKFVNYRIGLWQFGKTGFYKLNIPKRGTTATQLFLYAQKTKEDGTTPEDPFSQDNLLRISPLTGDKQVESVFVQVDYTDTDTLTVYKVQFLNVITFPGTININTYNKTTQKWDFTSVTESSAKWANNATQVSNALTLTKGDTTTKFDGSTAQTVSIPTKTSELTNDSNFTTQTDLDNLTNTVVSYNAQENITDEQKAQARTNIDAISSSEVSSNYLSLDNTQELTEIQQNALKNKLGYINNLKVLSNWVEATEQCKKEAGYVLVIQDGAQNDGDTIPIVGDSYPVLLLPARVRSTNQNFYAIDAYGNNYTCSFSYPSFKFTVTKSAIDQQTMRADPTEDMQIATKKYVDNSSVQSDWNQNDTTAKDYIKNRICYEETVPDTYEELQLTTSNWKSLTGYVKGSDLSKMLSIPLDFIVNGVKHYNVSPEWYFESKTEIAYFFNESKTVYVSVKENDIDINGVSLGWSSSSSNNISFLKIIKHENLVKQIDSKYIPIDSTPMEGSTNAASSDALAKLASNIDGFINALPEFVVAVTLDQSKIFTDDQKQVARNNIGAVSSSDLVQSDWNQNDTSSPAYIQNRPGGYYSVVNSVNSGTLTTTDFIDLSSEGLTGYAVQKETLNTALQNLNVTAGKTYEISWVDNGQAFSYISEAVDQVKTEGSVTYHDICIFGDTTVNLTAAELIWGKTAKVIILGGNSVATATNTVTNIKVEELNVVKIPKALVESDNIEEFDLSNNYTTTNKGSIKYNYIGTSIHAKETIQSALLGFKDDGSIPQLELFGSMMDTNYKNTTQYLPASIYSSWVNHSETGDTFIHGMTISHDPNNELLELESKLVDNITEDLTVRGIATPTADNDAVNKKYVDDKTVVDTALSDTSTNPVQNKVVKAAIDDLQASIDSKPSAADAVYTATAASTDGVAYTATVSGIDSLTVGASFIMIPNKASTSKAPTLNVNGLGAKPIRRRLSSLTTSLQQGYSTNWIALNKPFTVVYDGTAWVIEGLTKTDGADVYGAVAQATADAKGNNIADTYATIAMLQSLLPKVTTITLTSNWVGDASPYYQDIALSCVTETSIVDLQPTPEQLNSWQDDGIAFTTLSGNGTVRVYVAGGKPSSAISVQVRVQEVTVI